MWKIKFFKERIMELELIISELDRKIKFDSNYFVILRRNFTYKTLQTNKEILAGLELEFPKVA